MIKLSVSLKSVDSWQLTRPLDCNLCWKPHVRYSSPFKACERDCEWELSMAFKPPSTLILLHFLNIVLFSFSFYHFLYPVSLCFFFFSLNSTSLKFSALASWPRNYKNQNPDVNDSALSWCTLQQITYLPPGNRLHPGPGILLPSFPSL